jgi:hypothetical protein
MSRLLFVEVLGAAKKAISITIESDVAFVISTKYLNISLLHTADLLTRA